MRASSPDPELPEPLAEIFAKAAVEGAPARALAQEKEVLLLDLALHPERTEDIIAEYQEMYRRMGSTPGYTDLAHRFDELADLDADADAVDRMAAELAGWIRAEHAAGGVQRRGAAHPLADLVISDWGANMPTSQRRVLDRAMELVADLY